MPNSHVFTGLDPAKNPKAAAFVSASTAQRLLQALRTVPQAGLAVDEIFWIATARGLTKEVVETLNQLPGDPADAKATPHDSPFANQVTPPAGEVLPRAWARRA